MRKRQDLAIPHPKLVRGTESKMLDQRAYLSDHFAWKAQYQIKE